MEDHEKIMDLFFCVEFCGVLLDTCPICCEIVLMDVELSGVSVAEVWDIVGFYVPIFLEDLLWLFWCI